MLLALFAFTTAAAAAAPNPQRIVGGTVTSIINYPSLAALLYSPNGGSYQQTCSATILNNRALLTAAHCVVGDPPNRFRSRVGSSYASSGGASHYTQSMTIHPDYDSRTMDSDIAIIRTSNIIIADNYLVRTASIAGANYNLADNQIVWTAGWGATVDGGPRSEQLRHVQVWTINQITCRQRYLTLTGSAINDNMLCSAHLNWGGRGQCQGDGGSPLFHNGVVVGVFSWGRRCASGEHPSVNTRVSRFSTWIQVNA